MLIPANLKHLIFDTKTVLLLFISLLAAFTPSLFSAYADILVEPAEMHKNSFGIITISGSGTTGEISTIKITLKFPDGTTQEHTAAAVGKNNAFEYYLNPGGAEFPPGTYTVKIYSVGDSSKNKLVGTGAFNLYDSDDDGNSFEFIINRGASAKSCDGCIMPVKTTVYKKSVMMWYNNDSAIHDIQYKKSKSDKFVGILKPGESRSLLAVDTGTKKYQCTIHPWVYGEITVIANKFGFPARTLDDVSKTTRAEPVKTTENKTDVTPEIPEIPEIPEKLLEKTPEVIPCDSCYGGTVTKIVDGDTLDIDGKRIRLALVDTPERGETGYRQATNFVKSLCPVGSTAFYSIDKKQPVGPYGRIIAEVFCDGVSLNQNIAEKNYGVIHTRYCDSSDFASSVWAAKQCRVDISENGNSTGDISHDILENTIVGNVTDNIVGNVTDEIADNIAEIPSEVTNDFVLLSSNDNDSNPFDPNNFSITPALIIVVVCVGIVAMIVMMTKKTH